MDKNKSTFKLAVTAIMIALGTILSLFYIYRLPFGGSITVFSMLPVLVIGYMYGVKWGLLTGFVYGILQCILGAVGGVFASHNAFTAIMVAVIDYFLAFMAIGLSGIFKNKIKNTVVSFTLGSLVAMLVRLLCHFVSGFIFFGSWAEWYFTQEGFYSWGQTILNTFSGTDLSLIYSLIYNTSYMIPEIIITLVVGAIISGVKPIQKFLK